jgi:pimeloyl-ACP methyl ester carboxylesterase
MTAEIECGSLTVPADHDNPANSTFDLFIGRRKANGTTGSLGSLFFNTGGPGGSANLVLEELSQGQPTFSQAILESYDLIGVDPRGIGYSHSLSCDKDVWNNAPTAFIADDAGFTELLAFNKALGESCLELSGPIAGFMDSVSTIKDFELVRQALGADKFNYIGFSYGTLLGQTYAELYPEHVGRMVLDGLVDHTTGGISTIMTESQTYQATLEQFFTWCNATASCSVTGLDLPTIFQNLTSGPALPAPQCASTGACRANVTAADILFNTQPGLVFPSSWEALADSLNATLNGDASGFSVAIKTSNTDAPSVSDYANRAVFCQDYGSYVTSAADLIGLLDVASKLLPFTRGASEALAGTAYCAGWPAPFSNPPRPLKAEQMAKLPPLMLVNSFFDPETSAVWAVSVRQQIPSAVNVWRDGAGHTSYLEYGDTSKAMDEFLISGSLPAAGTVYDS